MRKWGLCLLSCSAGNRWSVGHRIHWVSLPSRSVWAGMREQCKHVNVIFLMDGQNKREKKRYLLSSKWTKSVKVVDKFVQMTNKRGATWSETCCIHDFRVCTVSFHTKLSPPPSLAQPAPFIAGRTAAPPQWGELAGLLPVNRKRPHLLSADLQRWGGEEWRWSVIRESLQPERIKTEGKAGH